VFVPVGNGPTITAIRSTVAAEFEEKDFEHEEECAFEDDSVEVKVPHPMCGIHRYKDGRATDPTYGQAVAFEMDLVTYLQKIRPEITLHQIEGIREAYVLSDESFVNLLVQHGFLEDQAERIADILTNEAAFEQDEEDNETDLEGRLEAAFGGC